MANTKEKRSEGVLTLLRPTEKRAVEQRAEAEGLSLSTFTRRVLLRDLQKTAAGKGTTR